MPRYQCPPTARLVQIARSTVNSTIRIPYPYAMHSFSKPFAFSVCTSSGARAMHGFGAVSLLRRSRCVFLAPQCLALRCPWMSALIVPVVRAPSCARGPHFVFVYCICTTELNCSTVVQYEKKGGHETRTNEIPFNRKDVALVPVCNQKDSEDRRIKQQSDNWIRSYRTQMCAFVYFFAR